MRFVLFAALLIVGVVSVAAQQPADLVLRGGAVITLEEGKSGSGEARAVAVSKGRIVYVGDEKGLRKYIGPRTRVVELKERVVTPGLQDAHAHMLGLGQSLESLDLRGRNLEQIRALVAKAAKESRFAGGEWIFGQAWDQTNFPDKRFPSHAVLDDVAGDHPVLLSRVDGHAIWVNRKAMEIAGVTRETKNPPGGKILRDEQGEPTGVFLDNANALIEAKIPPGSPEVNERQLLAAMKECNRYGLVGVHDAGVGKSELAAYKALLAQGKMTLRIYAMIGVFDGAKDLANPDSVLNHYLAHGPEVVAAATGDGMLTVRSIKMMADGAMGSRGGALLAPYSDDPGNSGLMRESEDSIYRVTKAALEKGFQVNVHAIGDLANRVMLNAFERALREVPAARDPRLRDEHAQLVAPEDIPRFARLGVIASMQPTHATSDMKWAEARVGPERVKGAYAWRSIRDAGARLACGSDFPVELVNPVLGLYAAVSRQDTNSNPPGGWLPQERLTAREALRCFTMDAAYAAFAEKEEGTIAVGKRADLVVWNHSPIQTAPKDVLSAAVEMTIVGGKVVYEANRRAGKH